MSNENIVWHEHHIDKLNRSNMKKQKACILWFTGLSGSGKSTIANALEVKLHKMNKHTYLLDGDNIRMGLNNDLGFSNEDRVENIRRIGEISKLFVDSGTMVLTAFISPFCSDRELVRDIVDHDEFVEIYIDTPLEVCENRDPKGLYKKARAGKIPNFTGIDSPYESPKSPEIHLKTNNLSIDDSIDIIIDYLQIQGYLYA
jgi:adenylylsulfate kinase